MMRVAASFLMLVSLLSPVAPASAAVRIQGSWPDLDKPVSVDARKVPRSDAIRKLADAAGWSVMVQGVAPDEVDIHVTRQPAGKVLGMLLADRDYVASRDGDLVSIVPDTASGAVGGPAAASPAASASSVAGPVASDVVAPGASSSTDDDSDGRAATKDEDGSSGKGAVLDRVITGGNVRVERGEVVHDVAVFGGNADVLGTATGDVTVIGGRAHIQPGAHVKGDVTVVGGDLTVDDGARVDGDVGVVGGMLHQGEHAEVGRLAGSGRHGTVRVKFGDDKTATWTFREMLHDLGASVTRTALLFVFGAIFLALAAERMQSLQREIAARPMKSFALGVVGMLVMAATLVALCITIVGIPFAVMAALFAAVVIYVGVCAALTVAGAALLRHRTTNPYVHLGVGCALLLLIGWLPYVGTAVTAVVGLVGLGSLLATRGAGLVPPRARST